MTITTVETPIDLHEAIHDFEQFCAVFIRILDKKRRLVPLHLNRAQKHFIQHMGQRNIILKARQLGFSTVIQAYIFWQAVTSPQSTILLAHDDETTQKLRRMFRRFLTYWPTDIAPSPSIQSDSATLITFPGMHTEISIATAGTKSKGRGGTYTKFHGSEVAFWPKPREIVTGAMQGGEPQVFLESTANGAKGYFYELCMDVLHQRNRDWVLHFYPWWWGDEYRREPDREDPLDQAEYTPEEARLITDHGLDHEQIIWRRHKILELGEKFKQEYPEDPESAFLLSGYGFFGDIKSAFITPHIKRPDDDPHWLRYRGGVDWGQSDNYTVLTICDTYLREQVFIGRIRRMRYKTMRQWIIENCLRWTVGWLYVEKNSMGGPNIEQLEEEAPELGHDRLRVVSFETRPENKGPLLQSYAYDLQAGQYFLLNEEWQIREHNRFVSKQRGNFWVYEAESGTDDSVMANMILHAGFTGRIQTGFVKKSRRPSQLFSGRSRLRRNGRTRARRR